MNLRCQNPRRLSIAFVLLFVTLFAPLPVWGYVVFLKDGTQIVTREKYERKGDEVFLILESGTRTVIDAAEIDFQRTDKENITNLGSARVIEGTEVDIRTGPAPPPRTTLSDLAGSRNLAAPEAPKPEKDISAELPVTNAGFVDLMALPRRPFADVELDAELSRYLGSQGIETFKVFQGTSADRPLLEVVANNEAAVFKALRDGAGALSQLRARFPDRLNVLELLIVTERDVRAGQFTLTPELAHLLARGGLEPETFFYRYVEF